MEQSTRQVLAVFRWNNAWRRHHKLADISYDADLGQELELLSLAAVLGIEMRIARQSQNAAFPNAYMNLWFAWMIFWTPVGI